MDNQTILAAISTIIANQTGLDEKHIRPEMKLVADIGCDSLDGIEIVMAIEDEFAIEVSDEEAERLASVNDILCLVCAKKSLPAPPHLPPLKRRYLTMELPNGEVWGVPVDMIARNRAAHYAKEFDGDMIRSLAEDTIPLFNSDDFEVKDWAENNMNWCDFDGHQVKLRDGIALQPADYWMETIKELQ